MDVLLPTVILAWSLLASPPVPGEVHVVARDRTLAVASWTLDADGGVAAVTSGGQEMKVAGDEVLVLITERGTNRPPVLPRAVLLNGEIVAARLAPGAPAGHVSLISALWERLDVPIDQVSRYTLSPAEVGRPDGEAPLVILRNGDTLAAGLERIGPDMLTVNTDFGQTQVATTDVAEILLSTRPPDHDARTAGAYLVELTDGQRFHCDSVSSAGERLSLRRRERSITIEPATVRSLTWPGAATARLSEMKHTATGTGYFGQTVVPERDRSARGRRLQIGQRWYDHGFGTRPRSRITFDLPGGWTHLVGLAGLDTVSGRAGDCVVAVMVNGRERFQAELRSEGGAIPFAVSLSGAGRIELATDFGPGGDLGDFVNWCEPVLIGLRQPETGK